MPLPWPVPQATGAENETEAPSGKTPTDDREESDEKCGELSGEDEGEGLDEMEDTEMLGIWAEI